MRWLWGQPNTGSATVGTLAGVYLRKVLETVPHAFAPRNCEKPAGFRVILELMGQSLRVCPKN